MAIPQTLFNDIRGLQRKPSEWFFIAEIKHRDRGVDRALSWISKLKEIGTDDKDVEFQNAKRDLYDNLEDWAARLLEREVRLYEQTIWNFCTESSVVPTVEDDKAIFAIVGEYINTSIRELAGIISAFAEYTPVAFFGGRNRLQSKSSRLNTELSLTIPLAAETARLEMMDIDHQALDKIGHAQIKIERFFSRAYSRIPHPFGNGKPLILSDVDIKRAIRLITYVVFKKVEEPRLTGFENKFINVFLRYLTSSREASPAIVEQVAALFEPFLKKLSLVFEIKDSNDKPLWPFSLDRLIAELKLSGADLKKTDSTYWEARSVQEGTFRLAYQLRHKAAHEAHEYPYYESERNAYFVFAALVISCSILLQSDAGVRKVVEGQQTADALRELFVRIDELMYGPDGPRVSSTKVPATRLEKLLGLSERAQAIWPNCSSRLFELLESEYYSVRNELVEADREAEIESYIDSMREDHY